MSKHSGSEWIKSALKVREMSPLGAAVADLLGDCYSGIYHLEDKKLKKVDWGDPYVVAVQISHQQLSTFDGPYLTLLVVLAHDRCLRMSIRAATVNTLELLFHQRQRGGDLSRRMPTIEEHIASIRRYHPQPEPEKEQDHGQ